MLKITKVTMSRRYEIHGIAYDEVEIQEPTGELYNQLGKPQEYMRTADNTLLLHTHTSVVKDYLDQCVIAPVKGGGLMIAAIDQMRVEKALLDFFIDPDLAPAKKPDQTAPESI